MEQKGLGKYALNPMYDKKLSSEMKTIETSVESEVFVINYVESTEAETLDNEKNLEEELTCDEGYQLMQKTGSETQVCVTEDSVSKLVERGWGTVVTWKLRNW